MTEQQKMSVSLKETALRDNYGRLAQIKATYDPSNLFHVNQNITPTNGGNSND